jgi:quercetin dioxygenase-like cupin family protein
MKKKRKVQARKGARSRQAKPQSTKSGRVGLAGTIAKKRRAGELLHVSWDSVAVETLNPLLGRQLVVGQDIMLARVLLKQGCVVPEHSHPNEQVTFILKGALKFTIAGREIVVNAGEVLTIPPKLPHRAEALADTVDLDVFYPPRADWLSGTDSYLR